MGNFAIHSFVSARGDMFSARACENNLFIYILHQYVSIRGADPDPVCTPVLGLDQDAAI